MKTVKESVDTAIIRDRIMAAMLGYAIGDALGKGTELMSKVEARHFYPDGLKEYSRIIRDGHRSQWKRNEWTGDTELLLLTADALSEDKGYVADTHARRIYEWFNNTEEEVVPLFRWILSKPEYLENPKEVAGEVWRNMPNLEASNEALGRCLILSFMPVNYRAILADGCRLTHHDSRCLSSAAVVGTIAHSLLWHGIMPSRETLCEVAAGIDERTIPFVEMAYNKEIADFGLDNPQTFWFTRLAMATGIWTLVNCETMEKALDKVVMEAGDADTNASLALALLGLKFGTDALPASLLEELNDKERVVRCAEKLAGTIIDLAENGIE